MFTKNSQKDDYGNNFEEFMQSDFLKDYESTPKKDKSKIKNFWNDDDESSSSHQIGTGKSFLKSSTKSITNKENNKDKISEFLVHNDDKSSSQHSDLRLNLNHSSNNYDELMKTNGYAHPKTFEGNTDKNFEQQSYSPTMESNSKLKSNKLNNGIETMKSNISTIPMDKSMDNFQRFLDKTDKDHLLSKVSLIDSYDEQRLNRSDIRIDDGNSTGDFETNINKLNRTGDSYYKNSLNPASGDSFNYTQPMTNVTDTVIGDTTAADLEAIHRQYEKYTNKNSDDFTPEANIPMSETIKEIYEDKSFHDEDISAINMESTIHSKSFGMKVIQPERDPSPIPTPRPRNKNKISKSDNSEIETRKDDSDISTTNRKMDNDYKTHSSRYSHIKSSGYGSKSIPSQKTSVSTSSKSQPVSGRAKSGQKNTNLPNKPNNQTFVKKDRNQTPSKDHTRSKSMPRFDENESNFLSQLKNETYHIRRSNEDENIQNFHRNNFHGNFDLRNKEWEEKWLEERKIVKKMQADSIIQEKDHKRQIEGLTKKYEEKISQLETQIVRLKQTKPDFTNKLLGPTITKEDVARIEQEMREQNSILAAYEKDNERLCQEIKILKQHKKGEDKVDSIENERLISQIVSLRAELDSKEMELRNFRQISKENRLTKNPDKIENRDLYQQEIAELKIELQQSNNRYLQSESEKQKAEMKLDKVSIEFDKKIEHCKSEMEIEQTEKEKLKEAHKIEVDDLKRKIKWYLENQAILDQNNKKINIKDKEIADLKYQIESSSVVKISSNIRAKERLADSAKMKHMEEEIMSLKEDLYLLAKGKNIGNVAEKRTIQFLEDRIKALESDNDKINNREGTALRSFQQQFETMKYQYEEKIGDLEFDLQKKTESKIQPEKQTRVTELRSKIDELNQELEKKSAQITRLKMDMKKIKVNNENLDNQKKSKDIRKIETDQRAEMLRNQLKEKDLEIQRLAIQNNYLKSNERKDYDINLPYRSPGQLELEAENAKYKSQIVHLTRDIENHRQALEEIKLSAIHNAELIREESRKEIKKIEEFHRENLNNVKIDYASRHSESDMANFQSQIEIQKNYIIHLQGQITDYNIKLRTSESKSDELLEAKEHIQSLKTELSDLRLIWSKKPGLEMIDRLRSKIVQLEEKENLKGKQLDEYVDKMVKTNIKQYQDEVERWRLIVVKKNQNLLRVQHELNQLLESLEELRRQGITIPKISDIKLL